MRLARGFARTVFVALSASVMLGQKAIHRFDVRDSIEMTTFSNPAQLEVHPKVCFSPNGSKFLIVTSRGDVATNEVRSELLLYDTSSVERFLGQETSANPPVPLRLARIASVPLAFATRSYAPLITGLRWSTDSRSVYFLGQMSDGSRRLYQVGASASHLHALSPAGIDVRQFAVNRQNKVLFFGGLMNRSGAADPSLSGDRINQDARVVTGLSLQQILFPKVDSGVKPRVDSLWEVTGTASVRVIVPNRELGGPDLDLLSTRLLELSPDSHYAICILPVKTIPASWRNYDPMPIFEQRRIDPTDRGQTSVFNVNRPRAYFLIDLRDGTRKELVGAPSGSTFGYHDRSMVIWPAHVNGVVVTNTFLPLSGDGSADPRRLLPCAVAWVNLITPTQQCVVLSRDRYQAKSAGPNGPLQLIDGHLDGLDDDSLALEFGYNNEDVASDELYVRHPDGWSKGEVTRHNKAGDALSLYIDQSLNGPPTLWAKDNASLRSRGLLDPNPQLHQISSGQASVYRWTDETGRKWEGGLVLPVGYQASHRYPLVIQTHGFEPNQFLVDGQFPTAMAARPLASVGIVVLQMGYAYDHITTAKELDDQLSGYRSAIDQLVEDGLVDRSRVGIIGFSRTAWHVEAALERAPDLFAAATIDDGIDVGYMQYMLYGAGNRALSAEFEHINGGPPFGEGIAHWFDRAVPFHLDRVRTPLRIEAIGPMSLVAEWENYSSLLQQGKAVDLIYMPQGQHILQSPLDRLASQEGNVAWFCFWLLQDPAAAGCPVVPRAEVERWKEMRAQQAMLPATRSHGGAR
jgi:hypothetical protein